MRLLRSDLILICLLAACSPRARSNENNASVRKNHRSPLTSLQANKESEVGKASDKHNTTLIDDKVAPLKQTPPHNTVAVPDELRAAVDRFTASLRDKNTDHFMSLFSRERVWYDVNTLEGNRYKVKVTYQKLKEDIESKTGLYTALFDADGDDCLRDYTVTPYDKPWRWIGNNTFSPPDADERSIWIKWRFEKGRWVVDAIAQQSA
jgi:hypothetical protein